jgi:plastocyanin domain-containing protein
MSAMSGLWVNLAGLILVTLVVWWFWLSKPKSRRAEGTLPIDIVVENGVYTPARIEATAGAPLTLRFLRKDPSPCAEKVLFDALGVSIDLPIDRPVDLTIQTPAPGEYEFTCQMRMYRGALVVR